MPLFLAVRTIVLILGILPMTKIKPTYNLPYMGSSHPHHQILLA